MLRSAHDVADSFELFEDYVQLPISRLKLMSGLIPAFPLHVTRGAKIADARARAGGMKGGEAAR